MRKKGMEVTENTATHTFELPDELGMWSIILLGDSIFISFSLVQDGIEENLIWSKWKEIEDLAETLNAPENIETPLEMQGHPFQVRYLPTQKKSLQRCTFLTKIFLTNR